MSIIGNLVLAASTLLYIYFLGLVFGPKPPQSGDAAVGYPFAIIVAHLLLLGGLTIVAIAAGWKGGLDWISPSRGSRLGLTALGLVSILLVSALAALFKYENGPVPFPYSLKLFTLIIPALFPLALLITGAIGVNGLQNMVPLPALRIPMQVIFGLAMVGVLSAIGGWLSESAKNAARVAEANRQDQERWAQGFLEQIDTCDATSFQVANILTFTSKYQDPRVREKALAKVKSNPQWQQLLVQLIDENASLEVFQFLAHNEVDDKALFAEPVNRAILQVADWIRRTIRDASHPSHLYEEQFSYEVDRVLLTVEQFQNQGVDYRPAIQAMRDALEEPSELKTVTFKPATRLLDDWLKKHPAKS